VQRQPKGLQYQRTLAEASSAYPSDDLDRPALDRTWRFGSALPRPPLSSSANATRGEKPLARAASYDERAQLAPELADLKKYLAWKLLRIAVDR
jgi:hypothetical protein